MTSEVTTIFNVGWQNSSSIGQQHHLLKAQCYGIAFSLQQLSQTSIADLIKKRIEQGFGNCWIDLSFVILSELHPSLCQFISAPEALI